jgi:uroporphyrinogen decarboxylase
MTASERLKLMVEKKPFDKVGASAWWHLPTVDRYADKFVAETIRFTDANQWDFIKVMPNPHLFAEAYGADIDYLEDPRQWAGKINRYPIIDARDLERLGPITPRENKVLAREIDAVQKIAAHYAGAVPVIPTLFTPLTWVQEMSHSTNPEKTLDFIHNHKRELRKALETLLEVNLRFIDGLVKAGADGFFIASQYAKTVLAGRPFTAEEFNEFEYPFVKAIVDHLKNITWFNMLHIHGERDLRIEPFLELEVQAVNWENTHPEISGNELTSIAYVRSLTDKIIIAGVDREKCFEGPLPGVKERLKRLLEKAFDETRDERLIFAPGCALELTVHEKALHVLREAVDEFGRIA